MSIIRRIKSNYLLQILFSHFIVLIFPTMILGIIISTFYIRSTADMVLSRASDDLRHVAGNIDMQVSQLNEIALQISANNQLSTQHILGEPTSYLEVYKAIGPYISTNKFAKSIFFYNKKGYLLYSAKYAYNIKVYFEMINGFDNITFDQFKTYLGGVQTPQWFTLNTPEDSLITYAVPVFGFCKGESLMLFMFDRNSLSNLVGADTTHQSFTAILDGPLSLVYSTNPQYTPDPKTLTEICSGLPQGSFQKMKLNNQYFYISYYNSAYNNMSYIRAVPEDAMLTEVRKIRAIFIAGLSVISLLGSTAVVLLSRRNYIPIKKLASKAQDLSARKYSNLNEIELTNAVMENLSQNCSQAFVERTITNILYGRYSDGMQLERDCMNAHIRTNSSFYRTILFNAAETGTVLGELDKAYILDSHLSEIYTDIYLYDYCENSFVTIVCGDRDDSALLSGRLDEITDCFFNSYGIRLSIGIGKCYPDIKNADSSFKEARIALNHVLSSESREIISYEDITSSAVSSYIYPRNELDTFYKSICACDTTRFRLVSEDLLKQLDNDNTSFFMHTCMCYEMANLAIMALQELNMDTSDIRRKYMENIVKSDSPTLNNIRKVISGLCIEIANILQQYNDSMSKSNIIDSIIHYIRENFTDSNLSAKGLAAEFKLSVSNLSHQFKKHTGKNLSLFIDELRLDMAKKLLLGTSLTIERVSRDTGYILSANLIRKFKQYYNQTPTEYRNNKDIR